MLKKPNNKLLNKCILFVWTMLEFGFANANPSLDNVSAGNAVVTQNATTTEVQQTSQQAILNWNSFNIGVDESIHFQQPAGGVALNRINPSQGASQIFGQLSATGKIILVNGAGIHFGPSASVNVGSLIASTANISDANFLADKYVFDQPSSIHGSIINEGQIKAAQYGLIALLGSGVSNTGLIQANLGNVVLGVGNKFTLDFYGDELINFSVDEAITTAGVDDNGQALKNGVSNKGTLLADGGKILVSVKAAQGVMDTVINMEGVSQAKSVAQQNGVIIFSGGDEGVVNVVGNLDVSGKSHSSTGGTIKILGKHINITSTANIDATGDQGGGKILVGGNYQGKGPEKNALTTYVASDAVLNSSALTYGNGGTIIVWADDWTLFHGSLLSTGGLQGGNGGLVETSGHYLDVATTKINLSAANGIMGAWLLDPWNITISNMDTNKGTFSGGDPNTYTPNGTSSNISITDLVNNLALANVIITTASGGSEVGDITLVDALTWVGVNNLTLTADGTIFVNAPINGGSLIFNGTTNIANDITTTGNQIYNSAVTVSSAAVLTGSAISMQGIQLNNDLTINTTSPSIISGSINGAGALTKLGSGILTLSGANVYSGATTLSGGTLQAGAANAFSPNSALSISLSTPGVYLDLNNFNNTIFSLSGGSTLGGDVLLGSGTLTLENSITTNLNFGGVISGSGGLTLNYSGVNDTLSLSGDNTYTGVTNINSGRLRIGNFSSTGSLASSSLIQLNSSAATLSFFRNDSNSFFNSISGIGNVAQEAGTTTLFGTNTYSGLTSIGLADNLTLRAGAANVFSPNSEVTFTGSDGTLDLNGFNNTVGSLSSGGIVGATVNLGSGTLTLASNTLNTAFTGSIIGSGSLNKTGTGSFILNGNAGTVGIPLASISTLGTFGINGLIYTTGSQIYNNVVNVLSNSTLTANTGNISFLGGVNGTGLNLTLVGGATNNFLLSGGVNLNSLVVSGGGGSNTLSLQTTSPTQMWTLNSINGGGVALSGVASGVTFTNIQSLVGSGNSNTFNISSGSITGSITGTGSFNTLIAGTVGTSNIWNLAGVNSGNVAGVGSFNNIQNLTGSNLANTFNFANNAILTGTIDAASSAGTNTIDYSAYSSPITSTLTADYIGNSSSGNTSITGHFNGIQSLIANGQGTLIVSVANKSNTIHITGPLTGYVNDPVNFSGYSTFESVTRNTTVIFDTPATVNYENGFAYVGGVMLTFINMTNFGNNVVPPIPPMPPSPSATILNTEFSTAMNGSVVANSYGSFSSANPNESNITEFLQFVSNIDTSMKTFTNQVTQIDLMPSEIKLGAECS